MCPYFKNKNQWKWPVRPKAKWAKSDLDPSVWKILGEAIIWNHLKAFTFGWGFKMPPQKKGKLWLSSDYLYMFPRIFLRRKSRCFDFFFHAFLPKKDLQNPTSWWLQPIRKNSQIGNLPPKGVKIKSPWNHHLAKHLFHLFHQHGSSLIWLLIQGVHLWISGWIGTHLEGMGAHLGPRIRG